ncbi:MAG: hypothetical protein M1825_001095 [Sarcosagium campestre]|nr:MAG: hypothetical protein M1825_001095 [Sarcosagium campestre]
MIGRPSVQFRKIQVFAVVSFWSVYLYRGNKNGPPFIRRLSRKLTPHITAWQQLVITLLWLYVARNFGKLLGLECPEPLANLYSRSYFRATWVTTALDAGFWTAMRIRRKWIRDLASIVFTVYYLIAAEQADEKVRKVRGTLTVEHLRVSWNKSTTPYLAALAKLRRPRLTRYPPRAVRIVRPPESSYTEPINAWLYFDGPISALKNHTKVILDIPGGGFVAMTPRSHEDKLLAWAGKTGLPVLSVDYAKAPEHPYPFALNECYDVYHTLVASRGRCIGLSGEIEPRIVLCGDSAGGNIATAVLLMILQSGGNNPREWQGRETLPTPEGLVLIYPALDMNIGNWMTDEQMSLIKDKRVRRTNKPILRRKSEDYSKLTPLTPHHSDVEDEDDDDDEEDENVASLSTLHERLHPSPPTSTVADVSATHAQQSPIAAKAVVRSADQQSRKQEEPQQAQILKTRLAMSSMISYFNDRILTPEMMRAMIILYIGPHNRPDFSTDFLLCPLLAPESLLARFPKTYFLTGERDPLVDDTVIMAGRIRQAKYARWVERRELGLLMGRRERRRFEERDHVEVNLIPGISHGFLSFVGLFPDGWRYIFRCARWVEDIFAGRTAHEQEEDGDDDDEEDNDEGEEEVDDVPHSAVNGSRHHRRSGTASSGDDDRPLEMSLASRSSGAPSLQGNSSTTAHAISGRGRGRRRGYTGGGANRNNAKKAASSSSSSSPKQQHQQQHHHQQTQKQHPKRTVSSVSLASEDDLVGRRMKGLAGGLMGMTGTEDP